MKQTTADKMLASLRRGADASPDALRRLGVDPAVQSEAPADVPADAPAPTDASAKPEPVQREVAEAKSKPEKKPAKQAKSAKPREFDPGAVQRNVDFDVSTGKGIKHLTIRVPKEMAADLALLAMRNKLSENGEPTTINELGMRAFERMLGEAA